jgi:hypothetical protein
MSPSATVERPKYSRGYSQLLKIDQLHCGRDLMMQVECRWPLLHETYPLQSGGGFFVLELQQHSLLVSVFEGHAGGRKIEGEDLLEHIQIL